MIFSGKESTSVIDAHISQKAGKRTAVIFELASGQQVSTSGIRGLRKRAEHLASVGVEPNVTKVMIERVQALG